ncbi:MAG: hypothetical protein PVF33_04085 [Candidatus Latescibacterota bacterium]|jgi:hypothetical protein
MYKQRSAFLLLPLAALVVLSLMPAGVSGEETSKIDKVTIDVLAKKPAKFVGREVRVEGVVARVMKDDGMFLMAENTACGGCPSKKACGDKELTVIFDGEMPAKNKKLKVVGVMTEPEKGKYVFKATRLE